MTVPFLTAEALSLLPGIKHGFFTRKGGVSGTFYESLNCGYGSGDYEDKVKENRVRVLQALHPEARHLCNPHQVHSAQAHQLVRPWTRGSAPAGDAVVTKERGIAIGILTADCTPVLFADAKAKVIAAAHAGWRGALAGIIEHTVDLMLKCGADAENIVAAIGPTISQKSYEVGSEFLPRFIVNEPENNRFFTTSKRKDHYQFDLTGFVRSRLENSGIRTINLLARDTCFEEDDFFSYRRGSLKGDPSYGRQISAIILE